MSETKRPMNSFIDVEIIKKIAQKDLSAIIKKCPGDKALVWDRALANPMNLLADHSDFKSFGVVKMLSLETGFLPSSDVPESVIFFCRPLVSLMPLVASCIRNEEKNNRRKRFFLLFMSRSCLLCEKWLDDQGVLKSIVSIETVPILLFPLDTDVLTMDLSMTFKEYYVENDPTSVHQVARAIVFLIKKYGSPSNILCKGNTACYIHELMKGLKYEMGNIKPQNTGNKIDNLIIIDRQIDVLSPFVTQLTYEGLIDELYGINNNHVKVPDDKFGESKTMVLNSKEELYSELRDKNFSAVGGILIEKTKEIREVFKQKDMAQSVGEMKRLVQQLPAVNILKQSLSNHTTIAEFLKKATDKDEFLASLECEQELLNGLDSDKLNVHIESLCNKLAPLVKVLRLIIIQNVTSGGLRPNILQHYEKLILQNYGFEHALTLQRLHKVGLLQPGSRYPVLRRELNLTVCDDSETNPRDFSYVHTIYAPLSIRFIQHRLKPNLWKRMKESLLYLLPGPLVDEEALVQPYGGIGGQPEKRIKTSIVVFVGGVTFAEISALRFLSQIEDDWEFLVVTTKIINGATFLEPLFDTLKSL